MANEPDAGDLISAGIMEGFRNISPFIEGREKIRMLQEDRDFMRSVQQEQLGFDRAREAREKLSFQKSLEQQAWERTQAEKDYALREAQAKQTQELTGLQIEASKNALFLEKQRRDMRSAVFGRMREQLANVDPQYKKMFETKLKAWESNPDLTAQQAIDLLERETNKLIIPSLISAIQSNKTAFKPEAAELIGMEYETTGGISEETIRNMAGFLKDDQNIAKMTLVQGMRELMTASIADGTVANAQSLVDLVIGVGTATKLIGEQFGLQADEGLAGLLHPQKEKGEATERKTSVAPEDARGMGAAELASKANPDQLTMLEITGDTREKRAAQTARKLLTDFGEEPEAIQAGTTMRGELHTFQEVATIANSKRPIGPFTAVFAALAPMGDGTPEDKLDQFLSSGKIKLPPQYVDGKENKEYTKQAEKFAESMKVMSDIDEKQGLFKKIPREEIYAKMQEITQDLVLKGVVGEPGAEQAALQKLIVWAKAWSYPLGRPSGIIGAPTSAFPATEMPKQ